jgi:hypothetical protein
LSEPLSDSRDVLAGAARLILVVPQCRDLVDPVVMARAWGDPDDTREGMRAANSMHETAPTMRDPRRYGQLPNLAAPDTVEDPLPDTEIDAWEGNSPC